MTTRKLSDRETVGAVSAVDALPIFQGEDLLLSSAESLASYVGNAPLTATGATGGRGIMDRFGDQLTPYDHEAVGDGVADDQAAITTLFNAAVPWVIPAGTYNIPTETTGSHDAVIPPAVDGWLRIAPQASFPLSGPVTMPINMGNLIPYQSASFGVDVVRKSYGSAFAGYTNIYQLAHTAIRTVAGRAVAVYGLGAATVAGATGWGMNPVGLASANGATGIGIEIDVGVTASGGLGYGAVIASTGSQPATAALTFSGNNNNAPFVNCIVIDNSNQQVLSSGAHGLATDTVFKAIASKCASGIDFRGSSFSTKELDLPSFFIGPTIASNDKRLRLDAGVGASPVSLSVEGTGTVPATNGHMTFTTLGTGVFTFKTQGATTAFEVWRNSGHVDYLSVQPVTGSPLLFVQGSSTNADIQARGKGSGGVKLEDGASAVKVQVNTTGVGFFATTPVAKQSVNAALSTGGAETNTNICTAINAIRTALINYGLAS